jgi:uncharacterized membrane protein YczE
MSARVLLLCGGLFVFAAGIVALLESRLGLSPWDVLHQGLAKHTLLSFGAATVVVSILVLAVAWSLGGEVRIGTVANAFLTGAFIQLLIWFPGVANLAHAPVGVRISLLVAGILLMGAGTGLYLGADLGAGPRDSLMVVGARRTPFRIGVVRAGLELGALAAGFALGGTVGIGTVAFAVAIGPSVELSFWLLAHSPLARVDGAGVPRRSRRRGRRCRELWERA